MQHLTVYEMIGNSVSLVVGGVGAILIRGAVVRGILLLWRLRKVNSKDLLPVWQNSSSINTFVPADISMLLAGTCEML
jgi:hypothetical protein